MQTVAMARGGRLAGMHFWLSKKAVDITRIGEDGLPIRQEQMLTMLDAEIDLGALLDSADQMAPALDAAGKSVALLEGAMPAGEAPSMAPLVDISGAMPLEPERPPTPASIPVASPMPTAADPEDRESILADLAARLGMSVGQERMDLLSFARIEYGQGWTKRPKDADHMIGEMQAALANPLAFREQVRARVREATQPV